MKNKIILIAFLLLPTIASAQICVVDSIINKLQLDSTGYKECEIRYLADTIRFNVNSDSFKFYYYPCDGGLIKNSKLLKPNDELNAMAPEFRKIKIFTFEEWIIITIPLTTGAEVGWTIFLVIPNNSENYFVFCTMTNNHLLLNDFNNNGKINFFTVDLFAVDDVPPFELYKATINCYEYNGSEFEKIEIEMTDKYDFYVKNYTNCFVVPKK